MGTHACVHTRGLLIVVVVEDMGGAEAKERASAIDFVEVVVGVCDTEVASIFSRILIGVTNERALGLIEISYTSHIFATENPIAVMGTHGTYVIVKIGVRDGHEVCRVRQVDQTCSGRLG